MAKMGYPNPPRCHNHAELYKPRSTTSFYTCVVCGAKYKIGNKTKIKMAGGMKCWCRKCKTLITLEESLKPCV